MPTRHDGRAPDTLRPVAIDLDPPSSAAGKAMISAGNTVVLCTASIDDDVPPWMAGRGRGWVTAEYSMLPGSTGDRKRRDRGPKLDGRTSEIQRLIGRSLRAAVNLEGLGERTVTVDCDVLRADGGTRTASITGAFVALVRALDTVGAASAAITSSVAAVSVGVVDGTPVLDLDYPEDVRAEVDMNVVTTGEGEFIEVQGTGEGATFSRGQLDGMLELAGVGIEQLTALQKRTLGERWPL
ncbi:MAG: ribonuclease PH [Planctomycetota bacterium]